jgi:hypothetical protein
MALLEAAGQFTITNPQLLEGAWSANAPRLSELVDDYKLIADLATTYGRIENSNGECATALSTSEHSLTA